MNKFTVKFSPDFLVNSLCAVSIGVGVVEFSTNIFFNKTFVKYFKEAYKNNHPVQLSDSLRKRYDDVIQDLKHTDFQKAFSTPFVAEGINPVNVGCLNSRFGCFIGIPIIYNLNSSDDTSVLDNAKLELQKDEKYVQLTDDESEAGQKFLNSLILSESAIKFVIARELVLTDNFRILIKSFSFSLTLLPFYAIGSYVINLLPANPAKIRLAAFFLLCNVGVFVWLLVRTVVENYYQNDADNVVGNTNEEYVRGGIEYYTKLIQRNLALRSIVPGGERMYSEQGNQFGLLTELPLVFRKKRLEHKLKKYEKENDEKVA